MLQSPPIVTRTRDLLGYAGSPPDPRWPGGARVAVSIVVNFEEGAEFSINDGDPENEAVYEIEQRLAGRPDPTIDSHFEGRRVAVERRQIRPNPVEIDAPVDRPQQMRLGHVAFE
jgi:allantoinase